MKIILALMLIGHAFAQERPEAALVIGGYADAGGTVVSLTASNLNVFVFLYVLLRCNKTLLPHL